jgi:predicted nucleic acid-binding Zn ribbon protein
MTALRTFIKPTLSFLSMPTYVYKFVETGETIEIQQSFTDDTLTEAEHPRTGASMAVKKVFQPVGVTFKGGGFYKTDSRGGSKAAASASSSADSAASTGPASGSESSAPAPSPAPAATPASTAGASAGTSTGTSAGSTTSG